MSQLTTVRGVPNNPEAVITFTGLLIVQFDKNENVYKVGIHPHEHHLLRLKIELRQQGNNEFKEVLWEHAYPPVLQQNLSLQVTNPDPDKPRLACFQSDAPLSRTAPRAYPQTSSFLDSNPEVHPEDFRWAMNLGWFHPGGLAYSAKAFQPHIRVENGIFYATKLLHLGEGVLTRRLRNREGKPLRMNPKLEDAGIRPHSRSSGDLELVAVAQEIGANLYFSPNNGGLTLRWIDVPSGTSPESLPPLPVLPPLPDNTYFRIIFDNGCRNADNKVCEAKLHRAGYGSDLPLYYEKGFGLLTAMPPEGALDITEKPHGHGEDFPCIPVAGP